MYVLSEQGLQLLDWSCLSIPKCPDNIVAEVLGADLSLRLYERYVHGCLSHNIVPLPLDRIQGDIQPLLSHLRFQTRFRRPDLVAVINRFHAKRSRLAPSSATEYRPREANFVADYLAGRGSAFLLQSTEASAAFQGIIEHDIDPPYELLLQHNASIFGKHAAGKTILVLSCATGWWAYTAPPVRSSTGHPKIFTSSRRWICCCCHGWPRTTLCQTILRTVPPQAGEGIHLCSDTPRSWHGRSPLWINPSFCQLQQSPHIEVLRTALAAIWGEDCCIGSENIIKMFPVRVINAGAPATLRFLQQHCLQVAGFVSTVAFDLDAAKVVCADAVLRHRADLLTTYTNRYFYACEYLEMQVMSKFVKAIQMRYRCASIIWLHDGVWLDSVVSAADIAKAEQEEVFPSSTHTERLFRTRSLATDYSQAVELFSNTPTTTYIFPAHPVPLPLRKRSFAHIASYKRFCPWSWWPPLFCLAVTPWSYCGCHDKLLHWHHGRYSAPANASRCVDTQSKLGPEADNFRPLGMPNTLDRLVDGTIASVVMKAVAPNMHPSQTVMSMFKEPARAVTAIQSFMDSSKASCALLADLSKAFERVNP